MAARPGGRRLPLVGRSAELSELLALCAAGGAALLAGPAGVGKSRLLDELAGRVAATGVVVLRGSAVVGGGPYRPLAEALLRAAPPALAEHDDGIDDVLAGGGRRRPRGEEPGQHRPERCQPLVLG